MPHSNFSGLVSGHALAVDTPFRSVYCALCVGLIVQLNRRLWRGSKGHWVSYSALMTSLGFAFIFNLFCILLDTANLHGDALFGIFTTTSLLQEWSSVLLYGAITLFLREEYVKQNGHNGNRYHLVTQSTLFSTLLVLYSLYTGLYVYTQFQSNTATILESGSNGAGIILWTAHVFYVFSCLELYASSYYLTQVLRSVNSARKYRSSFIYLLVTLYSFNVLFTIIASYASLPQAANDLLTQIFFFASVAVFLFIRTDLWRLKPLNSRESSFVTQTDQKPELQHAQSISAAPSSSLDKDVSNEKHDFEGRPLGEKPTVLSVEERILEELKSYHRRQEELRVNDAREAKEKEKKDGLQNQWTSESQVFSALSVVTVFIASLSVSLTSLARDTYEELDSNSGSSMSQSNAGYNTLHLPSARDNVYSCWYMATFVSLLAGCLSGLAAAVRNQMASDSSKRAFRENGPVDRALGITLLFVSIMLALAVVTLVMGLLFFTWTVQSTFVAVAMSTPGAMFTLALAIAITLYLI